MLVYLMNILDLFSLFIVLNILNILNITFNMLIYCLCYEHLMLIHICIYIYICILFFDIFGTLNAPNKFTIYNILTLLKISIK